MTTGEPADVHPTGDRPEANRLLLDVMLGKLAVYLRMCGYDAAYVGDRGVDHDDERIRTLAREEGRRLLSRDSQLIAGTDDGVLLTEREVAEQLKELRAAGFELALADPPTRCGRCNGPLEPVADDDPRPDYAPPADEFDCWRCEECGQWFWRGSHWDRVRDRLAAASA
ncbi:MAG: Mut7-C RNAse domain-containing protein [Halobacteriales archaeon]